MRKYYLVCEKSWNGDYTVFVHDNAGPGRTVLMEIEAENYAEAVKRVSFRAHSMGKDACCGVDVYGAPFARCD